MDIRFSFTNHIQIATFYFIKHCKKKTQAPKNYNNLVKEKFDFDKKPSVEDKLEEKSVIDILNNAPYNHIKAEEPNVEPIV